MNHDSRSPKEVGKGLVMLALGGIGEIGGNCYAYGFNDQWIIVDCGIAFPENDAYGIEVELPDIGFIEAKKDKVLALIVTHAHEDHLGGISALWQRMGCPVYATPFAASFLKYKLQESDFGREVPIYALKDDAPLDLGVFQVMAIPMAHSIPESRLLSITSPVGQIVHTGDWCGDREPLFEGCDPARLQALAEQGVLALVADSTNVFSDYSENPRLTEKQVAENLERVIAECSGRVVVTCFASNIARMVSIARAGLKNGRQISLIGRSMWRMHSVARELGYLDGIPAFKSADQLASTPDRECLYIVTGSQGEPRAALTRMAYGHHPELRLKPKDTVVYSSREIPGNERSIFGVYNRLALLGVRVITPNEAGIHASGHASGDEMAELIRTLKPQTLVPVHGEGRHLVRHAELAKTCGVPQTLVLENGECVRFDSDGRAEVVAAVDVGKLVLDGNRFLRQDGGVMRERRKIARDGVVQIAVAVNGDGNLVGEPELLTLGLLEEDDDNGYDRLYDALARAMPMFRSHAPLNKRCERVEKTMRQQVRKLIGKKPWVQVLMVEVSDG